MFNGFDDTEWPFRLTSPWGTGEDNTMFAKFCELITNNFKAVSFVPRDLVLHTVDFSIVLSTSKCFGILFNSINSSPPVR